MANSNRLSALSVRSLLLAGATFGFSSIAVAQTAPPPSQDPTEEQAAAGETQPENADVTDRQEGATTPATDDGEIVVTGSRIRRDEFTSSDPIQIINTELAAKEGKTDLATTLQSSPIAAGSTQITSALSSNFVTNGGPGSQLLDLRGLGPNRTLVLLNGRRAGPAGTRGGVSSFDLNVLPQSLVQSVEILKTGASSVYGSDAVAGVVNLLTKRDSDGLQLDFNASPTELGGGEQYRASALWGKDFGRAYITVAADYFRQNELARGERSFLGCPEAYTFRPGGERADLIDPRDGKFKCEDLRWGHVWTYNLIDNLYLDGPDGPNTGPNTSIAGGTVLIQYQYPGENLGIPAFGAPAYEGDIRTPAGWFPTGYDTRSLAVQNSYHPFVLEQTIVPRTKRVTGYLAAGVDITDDIELFTEFLVNRRETYQNGWRQFWNFGYTGDLYGTGTPATIWADGWEGVNFLSPTGITNLSDNSQTVDYYRGVGGLKGDIGFLPGWRFDSYVQYSRSNGKYRSQQILQDVYDSGYFQTASCVGTILPVSKKQCIDLPWTDPFFLRGELTPQQADFLTDWETGKTRYDQLNGEVSLSGTLFALPYGDLGVALGASIRRDKIVDTPGEITQAGNAWGASTSGITAGQSITKEAFGEVNVPILRNLPFARDLTFNAAARVTSVTAKRRSDGVEASDNGNWTYKLGGNYAPTNWLRFRATYGTSYRAPALFEQFLANETSFVNVGRLDPCANYAANFIAGNITQRVRDNCASQGIPGNFNGGAITATVRSQGGLGLLEAETSKAKTASVILTPRFGGFLSETRFNFAVDYFDIEVNGQISQLGAANIVSGCYNSDSFPTDPLCSLFTRFGPGTQQFIINTVDNKYINIASQRTSGFDFTTSVRQNLGRLGTLSFLGQATLVRKQVFDLFAGTGRNTAGEVGSPKFVADLNLSWTSSDSGWSAFYGIDLIGKSTSRERFNELNLSSAASGCITNDLRGTYCPKLTTPAVLYHAASVTKEIEGFDLTLGVSNLFNTRPPRISVLNGGSISTLGQAPAVSQYDWLGRRFFVNVSARLGRKR